MLRERSFRSKTFHSSPSSANALSKFSFLSVTSPHLLHQDPEKLNMACIVLVPPVLLRLTSRYFTLEWKRMHFSIFSSWSGYCIIIYPLILTLFYGRCRNTMRYKTKISLERGPSFSSFTDCSLAAIFTDQPTHGFSKHMGSIIK